MGGSGRGCSGCCCGARRWSRWRWWEVGVEVRGGSGWLGRMDGWIVQWRELSGRRGHGARWWDMGMLLRRRGVGMGSRGGRSDELLV